MQTLSKENIKRPIKAILDVHLNKPITLQVFDNNKNKYDTQNNRYNIYGYDMDGTLLSTPGQVIELKNDKLILIPLTMGEEYIKELNIKLQEEMKEYLAGNLCRCTGYQSQYRALVKYFDIKEEA